MSEYIINDEQIKEAVEFTPPYKTLSYAAKYKFSGAVERQGVVVHGLEEIVRCGDCKWYKRIIGLCMRPYGNGGYACWEVEPDGYCAWGERREP